jgi:hypothetical protein
MLLMDLADCVVREVSIGRACSLADPQLELLCNKYASIESAKLQRSKPNIPCHLLTRQSRSTSYGDRSFIDQTNERIKAGRAARVSPAPVRRTRRVRASAGRERTGTIQMTRWTSMTRRARRSASVSVRTPSPLWIPRSSTCSTRHYKTRRPVGHRHVIVRRLDRSGRLHPSRLDGLAPEGVPPTRRPRLS